NLPNGITINDGPNYTGLLSGTPTQLGTFSFTVSVIDNSGYSVQRSYSLTINAGSLQVTTTTLPPGAAGAFYNYQVQATGDTAPYTWTIAHGSQPPPANITLATNGLLSGIPLSPCTNSFIVRVTDSGALTTTRSLTL